MWLLFNSHNPTGTAASHQLKGTRYTHCKCLDLNPSTPAYLEQQFFYYVRPVIRKYNSRCIFLSSVRLYNFLLSPSASSALESDVFLSRFLYIYFFLDITSSVPTKALSPFALSSAHTAIPIVFFTPNDFYYGRTRLRQIHYYYCLYDDSTSFSTY